MDLDKFYDIAKKLKELQSDVSNMDKSREISIMLTKLDEAELWHDKSLSSYVSDSVDKVNEVIAYHRKSLENIELMQKDKINV